MTYDQTVFDFAADYVDMMNGPPNGLGQHVHPKYGQSHHMLHYMDKKFGKQETIDAITLEFKHRRQTDDPRS